MVKLRHYPSILLTGCKCAKGPPFYIAVKYHKWVLVGVIGLVGKYTGLFFYPFVFLECDGVLVDGNCYVLHNQQYNRESASLSCDDSNTSLAVITNQHQYVAVSRYIKQSPLMANTPLLMAWTAMSINVSDNYHICLL